MAGRGGTLRFWSILLILYVIAAALLSVVRAPSPFLLAGVIAGGICAVRLPGSRQFPRRIRMVGLAVLGVAAGSRIDASILGTLTTQPLAMLGGVVATLVVSMLAGQLLRLSPHVNGSTAVFASIAGGASGVAAVARELDADETIVVSIQYLRVLAVLATIPLVAQGLGATESTAGVSTSPSDLPASVAFTALSLVAGLVLASVLRFSASRLVLPLLVAAGLSLSGAFPTATVPVAVLSFGYATTGLMVGLSFTPAAVRQLRRLMPLAGAQLILAVGGCAAAGLAFAKVAGLSPLDGYLATTPGGLPVVTAVAIGSDASVGLIVAMQLIRVFLALLLAPVLGAVLRRGPERGGGGADR